MGFRRGARKVARFFCGIASISFAVTASCGIYMQAVIPDNFYLASGEKLSLSLPESVTVSGLATEMPEHLSSKIGNELKVSLSTFGNVAVKEVSVQVVERELVIPGGTPFGIKMFTEGVLVVGMSDIPTENGSVNPAKEAGICMGDTIISVNGNEIAYNEDLEAQISGCGGEEVTVELERNGERFFTTLTPALHKDDMSYRAGVWIRDSSAGLGTMTFIDPDTGMFAGLGHAVSDIDTGEMMPLSSGEITDVNITGLSKGYSGHPGELKGTFSGISDTGVLLLNSETGVFGKINETPKKMYSIPLAFKHEVKTGPAQIICTIEGSQSRSYDIVIENVNLSDDSLTKNMVIRVTDPELLDKTGGIIQGMSGSPIVQNGQLVGAASHVFVNEPTRGYAVFAENMMNTLKSIENAA